MKQLEFDYYDRKAAKHAAPLAWLSAAVILMLVVAVGASMAFADAPVTLNWTQPTQCTDGTDIGSPTCPALERSQLRCGDTAGGPYSWLWGTDASSTSDTRSYPDGEYYCILRTSNAAGWSGDSGEVHFTVTTPPADPAVPNAPVIVTIEVQPST